MIIEAKSPSMASPKSGLVLVWAFLVLLLGACNDAESVGDFGATQNTGATQDALATRASGIDPAAYEGEVLIFVASQFPTERGNLPVSVYAGLEAESETRLRVNALTDLREIQTMLDELISGVLNETCGREIVLADPVAVAEGERVRVSGVVTARFYRCRERDTADERQGVRYFTQTVEFDALATTSTENQCLKFALDEIDLSPRGLTGGLSNLFGITGNIQDTVLEEGNQFLEENPVCLTLPPALETLAPSLVSGGTTEIGSGGLGARISGTVDTSATSIVNLLAVMQESGIVEGQF